MMKTCPQDGASTGSMAMVGPSTSPRPHTALNPSIAEPRARGGWLEIPTVPM
jgi:hypothetical protein